LAVKTHNETLKLPKFELFEQGAQIKRASKSIKDNIVEGYGRRRYKKDFIKFLVYSHASCDETISQLEMISTLYPNHEEIKALLNEYDVPGRQINKYIRFVESSWK
jgi:four helix bundle protein